MNKPLALGSALLISTFLSTPGWAQVSGGTPGGSAQSSPEGSAGSAAPSPSRPGESSAPAAAGDNATPSVPGPDTATSEAPVDVSIPGASTTSDADIVVVGRNIPNIVRSTPQVVSVLSSADIARTGEGDIAGALNRVTGLSVVGEGFVYVRGLGDRYSLSLLNGSPLPSPEPLRRVVPLDIFPSRIVSSALVQKSYSPNFPGEFGGGVINLTTVAVPKEGFFSFGVSGGVDTETTGLLGYTYSGGDLDVLGYDDGTRKVRNSIRRAGRLGLDINDPIAISNLSNADTTLLQRNDDLPANFSAEASTGGSIDLADGRVGAVISAGYSSTWQTRDSLQQSTTNPGGGVEQQFNTVLTDNRVLVNGLIGIGAEIGDHKFRFTNVYIHDTVKQGRLAAGYNINETAEPGPGEPAPQLEQNTSWFSRKLYDLQGVGELKFGDLGVDLRGTYAKTSRNSPYERYFGYVYNPGIGDYQNRLTGSDIESATIAFSALNERVWGGGIDLSYKLQAEHPVTITGGYNYTDTDRTSTRYFFRYRGPQGNNVDFVTSQLRPDYLISDYSIFTNGIVLDNQSASQAAARYDAALKVNAGYFMAEGELIDGLRMQAGARYEDARESVTAGAFQRVLKNDYILPALTLTWNPIQNVQLRGSISKTVARPQFRELAPQLYQDFTSDREFIGNPFLDDSELANAEARAEWFFARDQRITLAGFYKRIKNPIEAVAFFQPDGSLLTGFSNAPKAILWGAELEAQKYVRLDSLGLDGDFFATKRLVLIGNYTFSKSRLEVGNQASVSPVVGPTLTPTPIAANLLFNDGAPLTGQSKHLVNLQLGFEDTERLQQVTLLFTFASKRVTNRGPVSNGQRLPDLYERPGIRLDLVAREEVKLMGAPVEIKFEARNLTGTSYREYQDFGVGRISINSYDLGRAFTLGATVKL